MRNKLTKIAMAATLAALLPLTSCDAANNPSTLVGHWLHESGDTGGRPKKMELFKDGTGIANDQISISWKIENKRFILQSPIGFGGFASDYKVSGSKLTFTSDEGEITIYLEKNSKAYQEKLAEEKAQQEKLYEDIDKVLKQVNGVPAHKKSRKIK